MEGEDKLRDFGALREMELRLTAADMLIDRALHHKVSPDQAFAFASSVPIQTIERMLDTMVELSSASSTSNSNQ
ncbi:MAG: hypothetical protein JWM37_375 [Candidatus Saccharibacteria bacterium]|nr:hypothetical protein [Candidatus Saccharibacteria bacterium]